MKVSLLFLITSSVLIFSGCNPLASQTNVDLNFTPGFTKVEKIRTKDTPIDQTDNSSAEFNQGTYAGVNYALLTDGLNSGLKMANNGGCNGLTTDCAAASAPEVYELNSSWTPKWANIIGLWHFNEASWNGTAGEVVDSSGLGTSGVSVAGATTTAGKLSKAASFNGTTQYIDANALSNPGASANITIGAWVYPTSGSGRITVLQNGQTTLFYNFGITLTWNGSNYQVDCVNSVNYHNVGGTVPLNAWTHVMLVYNGAGGATGYVNGVNIGTNAACTTSNGTHATARLGIGISPGQGGNFPGSLDEAAVWNAALTSAEVADIYARQSTKFSGVFNSRIIDSTEVNGDWTHLSWVPTLPFLKPLTNYVGSSLQMESTADYSSLASSTLLNGLQALWHLDETTTGTAPGGKDFTDSSGNGNHGTRNGTLVLNTGGRFGKSVESTTAGHSITIPATLNPWAGDFTLSAWVMTYSNATTWGIMCKELYLTNGFRLGGFANSIKYWTTESGGTIGINSGAIINYNTWNHVALTYSPGTPLTTLYVNGVSVGTSAGTYVAPAGGIVLANAGSWTTQGRVDEAAVWNRALSAAEVKQLYQRGGARLKFQARTCTTYNCAEAPAFKGPDGTSGSFYSELNNNSLPVTGLGNATTTAPRLDMYAQPVPPVKNEYFQYRAIFESDSSTTALMPEVKSVAVDPVHYSY